MSALGPPDPPDLRADPWQVVAGILPADVLRQLARQPDERRAVVEDVRRYLEMDDADLLRHVEIQLRNLGHVRDVDVADAADVALRVVLVPELCERFSPGCRARLRRITSSLAEYDPDPDRPSFFTRTLCRVETYRDLRRGAIDLRDRIARASELDAESLAQQARFAIAGSRSAREYPPGYPVYEPAFAYRMVPALLHRVLVRARSLPSATTQAPTQDRSS